MGALYYLKQKLVDFANVIQENVSRTDTVPSSKVVYDGLNYVDPQKGTLASGDLNACVTPGSYTISGSNTYTHLPSGVTFGVLNVFRGWHTASFTTQEFHSGNALVFTRFSSDSGSTWSAWQQMATNTAFLDYVNGRKFLKAILPQNGTLSFNVSGGARVKVSGFTSNSTSAFEYWLGIYSTAEQMAINNVKQNENITLSISGGVVTITNSAYANNVYIEALYGTISFVS